MAGISKKKKKSSTEQGDGLAAASGAGTVLTLFWKLAELDPQERLNASNSLIHILIHQQSLFTSPARQIQHALPSQQDALKASSSSSAIDGPATVSDTDEARAERIIDHSCTPDLAYSLRRLIRGLASPRQGARQGFAVALAELLSQLKQITTIAPDVLLTLILRASASTRSAKPAEARELLFARIFGIHALIRSRFLFQDDEEDQLLPTTGEDEEEQEEEHQLIPRRVMTGSNLRVFERMLDILLHDIATRKSWIKQSTTWLLLQSISALLHIDSADLSWRDDAIQSLVSRITTFASSRTDMDSLALSIGISPVLSPDQLKSILCPPLASPALLSPPNLPILARILKELPPADDESTEGKTPAPGSGGWNPDLHLVWDQLLDLYYPPLTSTPSSTTTPTLKNGAAPFTDFFRILIDDSLFAPTASPERKSWGFTLVQRILGRLALGTKDSAAASRIKDVPLLFQPNFMRTWINQLSDSSRILHKAARNTAQALLKTLQTSQAPPTDRSLTSLSLLTILLTPPLGLRSFDSITKTRTIDGILATLDGAGLDSYVSFLEAEIVKAGEGEGDAGRRKWAVDQLVGVVRFRAPAATPAKGGKKDDSQQQQQQAASVSALRDEAVVLRVLRFAATHGYFEAVDQADSSSSKKKKRASNPTPAKAGIIIKLDASTRALLRTRLLSSLQDLNALPTLRLEPDGKKHRVSGVEAESGELWVSKVWDVIRSLEGESGWKAVELPVSVPAQEGEEEEEQVEEDVEGVFGLAREKAEAVLERLRKMRVKAEEKAKTTSDRTELERVRGLEAVLVGTLLFVFNSRADAGELLEPLADAISAILKLAPSKKAKKDEEESDVKPDEAFVDAMLGLLNRPSAFLRALATQAFGACSDLIGADGLGMLFESLVPGDTDIIEEEDDDEDEEMDEDDKDDDEDEDEDDDSSSSETSLDSDVEAETEVDPELRSKVLKALQASGIADQNNGDEDDGDSDAESDVTMLDDEQMMKLDDKLASIFRIQAKGKSSADADEHKEALAQQNKVLDLLDSFATRQASSPLALTLISPLLSVIRSADKDGKQVATRAATILRTRLGGGKIASSAAPSSQQVASSKETKVDVKKVISDLEEVHQAATELNVSDQVGACVSANSILVRAALNASPTSEAEITRIHRSTLEAFFQRRGTKPNSQFVKDVLVRVPILAWWVRKDLLEMLNVVGEEGKKLRTDHVKQALVFLHTVLVHSLQLPEVSQKEVRGFFSDLNTKVLSILREACTSSTDAPPTSDKAASSSSTPRIKTLRELVKFVQQAARLAKTPKFSSANAEEACNVAGWTEMLEQLGESKTLGSHKALMTQVQQLAASLRSSSTNGSGRKKSGKDEVAKEAAPQQAALKKKRSRVDEEEGGEKVEAVTKEGTAGKKVKKVNGAVGKEEKRVKKVKT
ncbi:hypothetical protein A4X13_0g2410 [Tilletia indica]|uniref:DNA polymerase V n=1 Tax=Tilletia indica TaxID=43049 RepID=A0A177TTF3_9BASI|nr:hypothetical protein A4X13_0g2410 [Tilletia indica]